LYGVLAILLNPFAWCLRVLGTRNVREWTLAWESVVHPLGKKATMQWHSPSVAFRDFVQAVKKWRIKAPRGLNSGGPQFGHDLNKKVRALGLKMNKKKKNHKKNQ